MFERQHIRLTTISSRVDRVPSEGVGRSAYGSPMRLDHRWTCGQHKPLGFAAVSREGKGKDSNEVTFHT